jgi:acylglycerol lipase
MLAGSDDYADLVKRVRGWMCESPYIGLSPGMQPSTFIVVAGRLGAKILPHKKMVNGVPPEKLSRDPEVVRSLANDPLLHNTGTLEGLSGMLDRSLALTGGKVKMRRDRVQALWVGHGTEDLGTSCEATKRWFENCTGEVGDRVMKVYEGWFHQLHAEPGKEEFYEDVARWILERAGGGKEWRAGAEALEGEGEGSDVKTTGSETLEAKTIEAKL